MNGLFITGTDTGVGKTTVAAAIVRQLRQQGCRVSVRKPVATGAAWVEGRWLAEDTVRLAAACGYADCLERITGWAFPEPAAPPVAARLHGVTLNLDEIQRFVGGGVARDEVVVVEGVGGLLCPLTERETVADLAVRLGWALVVVVRRGLGTLNHTLLTLEAAQNRGLPVAGVVVNETAPVWGLADETNVEELRRRICVPILAVVPYQVEEKAGPIPAALAAVDWPRLSRRAKDRGD